MKKIKWLFLVFLAMVPSSCGNFSEEQSSVEQFFSNSHQRRDPTSYEASLVLRNGGCAAFLAENSGNKAFVISAKHCFDTDVEDWCDGNSGFNDNGYKRKCRRVVAWDDGYDIVMFEAAFPSTLDKNRTLQLAAYQPEIGTKLQMIGYPGDKYRQGKLSVTDNCWILKKESPSPYGIGDSGDTSSKHNCTTYGGNSGGPMIQLGTRVALGLPFTYYPDHYELLSSTGLGTAASMAQMAGFVQRHRATLVKEGIAIQDNDPEQENQSARVQQIIAYGKYWTLNIDRDYVATNPGGLAGTPLVANPFFAKGPCLGHETDCSFDAMTIGTITRNGVITRVQQFFAYGKYWTLDVDNGYLPINPNGMAGTSLLSNQTYAQGPCQGIKGECRFDAVALGTIVSGGKDVKVQQVVAYGKYWTFAVDSNYTAINPGGNAGYPLLSNPSFSAGPCKAQGVNCRFDDLAIGTVRSNGTDLRVQQVYANKKYWTFAIDDGYKAINPGGLNGTAYSSNSALSLGPCKGDLSNCKLDAFAIGQLGK